jgi:branched-chain amino acid transport system substrate-binding protein
MKKIGIGMFILSALVSMVVLPFSPYTELAQAEQKELKIGALMGLSGPGSESLKPCADGITVAANWINNKGGLIIGGEKYLVRLIGEDMKMSPDGTIAATNKLVYDEKVKFMVGTPIPPFKAAAESITGPNKVLRMDIDGPGSPDELNAKTPYTFTTVMTIFVYGIGFDYFMEVYPKVKTIALVCPEDPGAIASMVDVKKQAAAHGLTVLAEEYYPFGTTDFYPMLTKLLATKPDALVQGAGFAAWIGGILKQGREMGFKGPMLCVAHPAGDIYVMRDVAGKYATDFVTINYDLKSSEMTPMIKEIAKVVKDKFGVECMLDHILGWEALWDLTQGIENAQSIDPSVVKDSFEEMKSIQTPFGTGKMGGLKIFGLNHVVVRPVALARIMNGKIEHIRWVTPEQL